MPISIVAMATRFNQISTNFLLPRQESVFPSIPGGKKSDYWFFSSIQVPIS